ncbi:DUF2913 family protein [Photobacterium leiognathi]|uniref:DUF2913 family protein n=1 Tax=Photobacterium leiognathi TaxID=553611 RepID=UPI003BF545C8|nr:DUF2913 family protein [Photobacterium leiognathi]
MHESKFEFIENCLLHLYLSISMNGGHHSVAKRNKILIAYLKPKVKLAKFKFIKSEIKSMLAIAKNKDGDLEDNLIDSYKSR